MRFFDLDKATKVMYKAENADVARMIKVMIDCRLGPTIVAKLLNVKYFTVSEWVYGNKTPGRAATVAKIRALTPLLEKAHNEGLFKRSDTVAAQKQEAWYRHSTDYENIATMLSGLAQGGNPSAV